ncbi:MAG: diguanylate cyclase [Proteobacteria bacterium]|nr:diguanylate cyclase [Pseudomonadota bacterium]
MSAPQLNGSISNSKPPVPRRDGAADRVASETISRLQRGILRLALAYHGRSPDLDKKLKELGGLVRAGRRDALLQRLIDEIVNTIVTLNLEPALGSAAPATATPGVAEQPDLFHHFIDHLQLPPALLLEVERIRKRIAAKSDAVELLGQVEQASLAFSERLAQAADNKRTIDSARQSLIDLVDRIPVSRTLAAEAAQVRRAIEAVATHEDIRPCTTAVAQLVGKLREEMQSELDRLAEFLRATARRLQEFEQIMQRSREMYAESEADALQLSETICVGVREVRHSVGEADDLDALKVLIESKLEVIDHGLTQFVSSQSLRAAEAGDVIERMTHRLKDLEQQAMHLREDLEVQHARVLMDPLTGILNRAGYTETVSKHFARWKRYGGALSLAVIDLDLFKEINDRYGHAAGDKVLATVASKLKEVIRESDVLCRFGGEEFVLLLPETSVSDARTMLEKLRNHIADCPFRHKDTPVRVTMSSGVAQFQASDSVDSVFERADLAMYAAKQGGRNQVCTELDPMPEAPAGKD